MDSLATSRGYILISSLGVESESFNNIFANSEPLKPGTDQVIGLSVNGSSPLGITGPNFPVESLVPQMVVSHKNKLDVRFNMHYI